MRFAGTAISSFAGTPGMESFLDPNRPDSGEMAMMGDNIRAKESTVGTELQGKIGAQGIRAAGEVEAAGIVSQGQQAAASAQGNASMMRSIGGIGSSLIGAIPTGGSSTSTIPVSGADYSGITSEGLKPWGGFSSIGSSYF